jgi:hypothetical protein
MPSTRSFVLSDVERCGPTQRKSRSASQLQNMFPTVQTRMPQPGSTWRIIVPLRVMSGHHVRVPDEDVLSPLPTKEKRDDPLDTASDHRCKRWCHSVGAGKSPSARRPERNLTIGIEVATPSRPWKVACIEVGADHHERHLR